MALREFTGELDGPAGLKPFDGTLDGEDPSIGKRVVQGGRNLADALRVAATDDPKKIAERVIENTETAPPPSAAARQMQEEIKPYQEEYNKAEGAGAVVPFLKMAGKRAAQLATNPREFAGMIAENAPNSVPGMVAGIGGGVAGATLGGMVAGPPGAAVGGAIGAIGAGVAAQYPSEQGSEMMELVRKSAADAGIDMKDRAALAQHVEQNYPKLLEQSRLKGIGTAATDAVLNRLTLGIGGMGERMIAREANAITDAAKAGKIGKTEAAEQLVSLEAKEAARNTVGAKVARGVGTAGAEMVGEAGSEAAGQLLAYGHIDPLEVIDEGLVGIGQGAAMGVAGDSLRRLTGAGNQTETGAALERARAAITTLPIIRPVAEAQPAPAQRARVEEIAAATTVDGAIAAFNKAVEPIEFDRLGALGALHAEKPAAPATEGPQHPLGDPNAIPYDYSIRQNRYPALPSPDSPSGRNVLVNGTDPELTRAERMGDREAAINAAQRAREEEADGMGVRDIVQTPEGPRRRARVTLDERGNVIDAEPQDRKFLGLVKREHRDHAAAAINAHDINPTLTEAVLAAPDVGPKAERAIFEAIIHGRVEDRDTRALLARYGIPGSANAAGPRAQPVNPQSPGRDAPAAGGAVPVAAGGSDGGRERVAVGQNSSASPPLLQAPVDQAAHEAATSPENDLPAPTEGQKEAGNYKKGHVSIGGLDVSIENPAGSKRRPEWPTLKSHYGYFKRTEGNDGDHVDTFIKPGTPDDYDGPVFVVDQTTEGGQFDEHKVMLGWPDEAAARAAYLENYTPDWKGLRAITPMSMEEFKTWLREGDTTKPAAKEKTEGKLKAQRKPKPKPKQELSAPTVPAVTKRMLPNVVIRDVRDRNGNKLGDVIVPYDGTMEGARKAAEEATDRMNRDYPDAGNVASRIGATDELGRPKWAISPNFRYVSPVDSVEGRSTFGDPEAIREEYLARRKAKTEEKLKAQRPSLANATAPVTTDAQRKTAEDLAKDVGGTVVWQEGDLALIRGYSILNGQPVYSVAMGRVRSQVDVESFTGKQLSPKDKARLVTVKKDLEAQGAKRHASSPFITFNADGLAFSSGVDARLAGVVAGWKKLLGLDANIYVTTIEDARADRDKFTGPHRAIGSAALDANEAGSMRKMGDGYYIAFTKGTSMSQMLETIAHELGHVHEREAFANAPAETQKAIRAAHDQFIADNAKKTGKEFVEALRSRATGRAVRGKENLAASELSSYWKSFSEWYADQVAKWAVSSDKPVGVVEKFFARLAQALKRFYQSLKGQQYLPHQTMREYLDSLSGPVVPSEVEKTDDQVVESTAGKTRKKLQEQRPVESLAKDAAADWEKAFLATASDKGDQSTAQRGIRAAYRLMENKGEKVTDFWQRWNGFIDSNRLGEMPANNVVDWFLRNGVLPAYDMRSKPEVPSLSGMDSEKMAERRGRFGMDAKVFRRALDHTESRLNDLETMLRGQETPPMTALYQQIALARQDIARSELLFDKAIEDEKAREEAEEAARFKSFMQVELPKPKPSELGLTKTSASWFTAKYKGGMVWTNGHIADFKSEPKGVKNGISPTRNQYEDAHKPDMEKAMPNGEATVVARPVLVYEGETQSSVGLVAGDKPFGIKAAYYAYFAQKYPGAQFRVAPEENPERVAIRVFHDGELVGVAMPVSIGIDYHNRIREKAGLPVKKEPEPKKKGKGAAYKRGDPEQDLFVTGMSTEEVTQQVASYDLPEGLRPVVMAAPEDAPFDAPDDAVAAFWKGKVYLFARNMKTAAEVEFALFHEMLGHYGLRSAFGKELAGVLRSVELANKNVRAEAARWMQQYGKDAIDQRVKEGVSRDDAQAEVRVLAIEEALADRAGTGETITGLQKVMAAIQKALRKIGMHRVADWLEGVSDAEAASVLAAARAYVETGRVVRADGVPTFARRAPLTMDAKDSPLYLDRTAANVGVRPQEDIDRALATDATSRRILAKGNKLEEGQLVGARLNINVVKNTGVPVVTIHKGNTGEGYTRNKGLWNGEALTYVRTANLKGAYFNVGQGAREKIASGSDSKSPIASVDGKWDGSAPNYDGVEFRFNPKREHLFIDRFGRAIRYADEVTIYGNSVFARGRIEYYGPEDVPARAGDAASVARLFEEGPSAAPVFARAKPELEEADFRIMRREPGDFNKEERAAWKAFMATRPDADRIMANLKRHKGTPWAKQAVEGVFTRQAMRMLIDGKTPKFQSSMDSTVVSKTREVLSKRGVDGLWDILEVDGGLMGHAAKPVNNVNSSFINCDPTDDCAKYCYATGGNYRYANVIVKSELVTLAVEMDPVRSARRLAAEYKASAEFLRGKALRLFDKGDGNEAWLPFISELNALGVRTQIFSKVPEFLRQVPDMNLRLLSIDDSNVAMADENQDLPVAFVYSGRDQIDALAKIAARGQLQVVLPVKLGRSVMPREEVDFIKKEVPEAKPYLCPIDSGFKELGKSSQPGKWNCTSCDVNGGIGCFHGNATKAVMESLEAKPVSPQERAKRIVELRKQINELTSGTGEAVAEAGRPDAGLAAGLLRQVDSLLGELLRDYDAGGEGRPAVQIGSGGVEAGGGADPYLRGRRVIPIRPVNAGPVRTPARRRGADDGDVGGGEPLASRAPTRLIYSERLLGSDRGEYGRDLRNPVTLKDGTRLDGFTSPEQTVFTGYDRNGERISMRREYVNPDDIKFSRDSNRTAEALKVALRDLAPKASRRDVTSTPQFKAWFGDSKVVDADGKPLHQTDHDGRPEFSSPEVQMVAADRLGPGRFAWRLYSSDFTDEAGDPLYMGYLIADIRAGKFKTLQRIEIEPGLRGQGFGEKVVAAMLRHNGPGHRMEVADIQHAQNRGTREDPLPFWKKVGTIITNFSSDPDIPMDGILTLEAYNEARPQARSQATGRVRGQDAQAGAGRTGEAEGRRQARQGTGLPVAAIKRIANAIAGGKIIRVAATQADLPDAAARFRSEDNTGIRGVYIPSTDEIWLVAENLPTVEDTIFVTLHEGVHRGLRALFGNELAPVLNRLWLSNKSLREQTAEYQSKYGIGKLEAIEEVLADMAHRGALRDLTGWEKLVSFIREWVAKLADKLNIKMPISDEQIQILVGAASRVGLSEEAVPFGNREAVQYSEKAPPFYSELAKQVAATLQKAAPAEGWKSTLKGLVSKGRVKADEIEWSGITDWLDMQQGKVTREAVLDYLRQGGVRVETTVLGGSDDESRSAISDQIQAVERMGFVVLMDPDGVAVDTIYDAEQGYHYFAQDGFEGLPERARDAVDTLTEMIADADDDGATKFASYTLPGGTDYREVLLTLPAKDTITERRVQSPAGWGDTEGGNVGVERAGDTRADFRSGHWDQPNVLAHFRADVVTGADGKRFLRVFEIQSDWGQKGKRTGFDTKDSRPRVVEVEGPDQSGMYTVMRDGFPIWSGMSHARALEVRLREIGTARPKGVPAAPFVQKTDAWVGLAIKRAIRMAADEGLDGIVFATGEQMVDLFDLSKQIESIRYDWNKDTKLYAISAKRHDERQFFGMGEFPAEKLDEVVGKDLAAKIIQQVEKSSARHPDADVEGSFSGLDLKVGGEGQKTFYDRIVPNVANDVLKKLGGGKVEETIITTDEASSIGGVLRYVDEDDRLMSVDHGEEDDGYARNRGYSGFRGWSEHPGFLLTDSMRERALAGMPLFSRLSDQLKGLNRDADRGLFKGDAELDDSNESPLTWKERAACNGNNCHTLTAALLRFAPSAEAVAIFPVGQPNEIAHSAIRIPGTDVYLDADGIYKGKDALLDASRGYTLGTAEMRTLSDEQVRRLVPGEKAGAIRKALPIAQKLLRWSDSAIGFNSDNGPRASRSPVAAAIDTLRSDATQRGALNTVSSLLESSNTFSLWHRTVGTQFHKARKDRDFGRVFRAVNNQIQDTARYAIEAEQEAPNILQRLEHIKDVGKALLQGSGKHQKDMRAVARAVFANIEGKAGVQQRVFSDAELRDQFQLNDRQIELYREFRRAVDTSLERLGQSMVMRKAGRYMDVSALKNTSMDDTVADVKGAFDMQIDRLQGLLDMARAPAEENRKQVREEIVRSLTVDDKGNLRQEFVRPEAKREIERATDDRLTAKLAEEIKILRDLRDEIVEIGDYTHDLQDKGYAPAMRFGRYAVSVGHPDMPVFFGMYESQAEANMAALALRREYPGEEITKSVMNDEAWKMFAGVSPETVELFARFMGADELEGFKQYIDLATSSRSAMQRMLERKGVAGFSWDATRVLAQFVTSNARQASINIHAGEVNEALHEIPREKGDVQKEAQKLVDYVRNPMEEASALRGLLFMHFMGGSLASAAVNLTQPVLMTAPYLSQFVDAKRLAGIMARAAKAAATGTVTDPGARAALARANDEGITQPHEIHHLMAEAQGSAFGRSHRGRAFAKAWGGFFALSESFNRKLTFLAAYEAATASGQRNPYTFAKNAVIETQGLYNKANRPNWARGPIGATLFTFKQFSVAYLEFLSRLPKRQLVVALAVLLVAAGLEGMPFAEDLEDIIDTVGQRLGYATNSKKALRKAIAWLLGDGLAEFVLHGFSAVPGFPLDVSARLGLSNLIPGTRMLDPSKTDKAGEVLEVFGAAGGVAKGLMSAVGDGSLRDAMPSAVRNAYDAYRMASTGEARDTRGRKIRDVTGMDAAVKAVGFQPASLAADSRRIGEQMRDIAIAKHVEAEISNMWARGIMEKDEKLIQQARDRLIAWNTDNPDMKIAIGAPQISKRVKEGMLTRDQRFIKTAPPELRAQVMREVAQ